MERNGKLAFLVFLTGLLSIVVQVLLLRELSAAFYGVDLVYLLALGAWLLWTATGAIAGSRSLEPSARRVSALLLATALVIPLEVALVRRLPLLLGGVPGAYLPLPEQMAASALCLLPPSLLLGLLFQATAKRYMSQPEGPSVDGAEVREGIRESAPTLARAYAIESAGGVAGGLAATLSLHVGLQNLTLAFAVAAVTAAAVFVSAPNDRRPASAPLMMLFSSILVVACAAGIWQTRLLDRWMTRWTHPDAADSVDSPYGRVTVEARAGQVSVYENGALTLESEGTGAEDFAHLSMIQHARPRRVLLIGGVAAGLIRHVAAHRPQQLDDVDLDRRMARLVGAHLPDASTATPGAVQDLRVTFDDPRRAVARLPARYDVIVLAASEPTSAQANRFFTREFFADCATHLQADGVISLRLASIENLWTPQMVARTGSIYAALREVFADIVVLPGATNVVIASRAPLVRDPDVLAGRLAERRLTPRLVSPRYLRYLYSNDRYADIDHRMRAYAARPNTDANAACYQATSLLWLSKFVPSLGQMDVSWMADALSWRGLPAWLLLGITAGLALLWRLSGWSRENPLVAAAASSGMTLEVLLLVHYQLKQGVMFEALGVLLTSVMAGLAVGAVLVDHAATSRRAHPPAVVRLALFELAALALATSYTIRSGYATGLATTGGALFLTGIGVAAVFSAASLRHAGDQRVVVSPLYAADVAGGSVGSLVAALLMIPLLGLPLTAEWAAAVAMVALILA